MGMTVELISNESYVPICTTKSMYGILKKILIRYINNNAKFMMGKIRHIVLLGWLLCCVQTAWAITPFVITDIRVEGLERLEAGTVFNYLPLKVGDELNDEEARLSIKELFGTGFFKDVELEQDGTVLVVKVVERPSISEINISGNSALNTEAINQGLEQVGLVQGRIFSRAHLEQVEREIKEIYLSLGRYSATVESMVEELERNRVAITLNINEGRVATIKKVNIIGAKAIPVSKVIEQMSLRDKRGFRLLTKRNQYSKQKLEADIEAIRSYYLDRGFHDFNIGSSNVDISPNKQNIFISISLEEGVQYVFGTSDFEINRSTDVGDLESLITMQPGEPFSRKVVNASRAALVEHYANAGYAFVEVRPIYDADKAAQVVNTVFAIEPKQRVYVRNIEITGNLYTRDQVIRRELRQFESAWYSASAVNLSKSRLRRLGYFEDVTIETPAVPGTNDQIDMKVIVKERNTGAIAFSLGYSDSDGALLGGSFAQRNLFGTGHELDVALNISDVARTASITYVDPYYTPSGVSRGITLVRRRVDTEEVSSAEYVVNTSAIGLNYKIPIAETNSLNLGFTLEQVKLDSTSSTPREFRRVIDPVSIGGADKSDGVNLLVNFGLSRDTRDDFFFPISGASGSAALDFTVPGSEFEYYKLNLQGAYYTPLPAGLSIKAGFGIGYGDGYGDSSDIDLPFFRRYFAGGSNSVRGYEGRSIGPRSSGFAGAANCETTDEETARQAQETAAGEATTPGPSNCTSVISDTVGGDSRLLVNLELLFPPFGSESSKDKRLSLFVDGGMVYGDGFTSGGEAFDESFGGGLRYSAGFVFNWFSPIGPFSMSYSEPLNAEGEDETEKFQITVGSVFR